jgi:hypothetical protein
MIKFKAIFGSIIKSFHLLYLIICLATLFDYEDAIQIIPFASILKRQQLF